MERLEQKTDAELVDSLAKELKKPDYNLEDSLNTTRDCPTLYSSYMAHLRIKEDSTLLAFSNGDFFLKHELSYAKINAIQNSSWAKEHYLTGNKLSRTKLWDQAIGSDRLT